MSSDPKEVLERLLEKATSAPPQPLPEQTSRAAEAMAGRADDEARRRWLSERENARTEIVALLPALIAKQEGLERRIAAMEQITTGPLSYTAMRCRAEAAEAQLSALPHIVAGLRFDLRMQCEFGPAFHQAIKDNLDKLAARALLPTVPVEES